MGDEILHLLHDFGRAGEVAVFYEDFFAFLWREATDDFEGFAGIVHVGGGGFVGAHIMISRVGDKVAVQESGCASRYAVREIFA